MQHGSSFGSPLDSSSGALVSALDGYGSDVNAQSDALAPGEFEHLLAPIHAFLRCETPAAWLAQAKLPENLAIILRDHLLCEQGA